MRCSKQLLTALLLASWVAIPSLCADTVELTRGGHVSGNVKRAPDFVIVQIDDDINIAIRQTNVERVVDSDQLQPYRQRAAAAGNSAEAHYELARWCMMDDNVPGDSEQYRLFHMRRAIAIEPDHLHARAALGYKKHKGAWIRTADLMRNRGMVMHAGHWAPAETVSIEKAADAQNVEEKKWMKEVGRLTGVALRTKNRGKAQEAIDKLRAIDDPMATRAIAKQLKDSRQKGTHTRAMRMMWIDLLGKFKNMVAVEALVQAGLEEKDEQVRERALDHLERFGSSSAVGTYLQYLKSKDNRMVNRAARALSRFPDPELALTYVDALVTEHKKVMAPGAGMQVAMDNQGGGGLAMGGKAKVKTDYLQNPAVLSLVKAIEPDANYGYDEKAWRQHFAGRRSTFSGDLRRDP